MCLNNQSMNLESIFRESLNKLKTICTLPDKGFIAGGSLGNLIWEQVSGNKAIVNDVDIFCLSGFANFLDYEIKTNKENFTQYEPRVFEDYSGLNIAYDSKSFYYIDSVERDGLLNIVNYKTNSKDPFIIIDSFDINCCQVGYDIETDKFYSTKQFETFLKTGDLRISSLNSPAHTAIRLAKKKNELNANLPESELDIISLVVDRNFFVDHTKIRFKKKNAELFLKYQADLESRFEMVRDTSMEEYVKEVYKSEDHLWKLSSKDNPKSTLTSENRESILSFINSAHTGVNLSKDFLIWMREIYGNKDKQGSWSSLHLFYDSALGFDNYLDATPTASELNLFKKLMNWAPETIKNLKGLTFSKQLEIVNTLRNKFKDTPIVGISILEGNNVKDGFDLNDEMDLVLLELRVRKFVLSDPHNKSRIFNDSCVWPDSGPKTDNNYQDCYPGNSIPF